MNGKKQTESPAPLTQSLMVRSAGYGIILGVLGLIFDPVLMLLQASTPSSEQSSQVSSSDLNDYRVVSWQFSGSPLRSSSERIPANQIAERVTERLARLLKSQPTGTLWSTPGLLSWVKSSLQVQESMEDRTVYGLNNETMQIRAVIHQTGTVETVAGGFGAFRGEDDNWSFIELGSRNESDENDSSSITLLPLQNGTKLLTGRSHLDQVVLEVFASPDSTSTILATWEQQGFQVVLMEDEENTWAVADQNDPQQVFGFQRIQVASAAHPVFKIQQLSPPRAGESLTQQVEKF